MVTVASGPVGNPVPAPMIETVKVSSVGSLSTAVPTSEDPHKALAGITMFAGKLTTSLRKADPALKSKADREEGQKH